MSESVIVASTSTNREPRRKKEKDGHDMAKLSECDYLQENDYDYLRSDDDWVERLKYRALNEYEVGQLKKLMNDLKSATMAHINDLFVIGPLKFYFEKSDFAYVNRSTTPLPPNASLTTATGLPYTASQDKFQVKAAFVATIIRHLILRDENCAVAEQDRQMFLGKYDFLGPQVGTSIELTWLNRFERSLRYLKRFIPAERNKILFLTVGNHLEGSTLYTTYITGGQNRPETERRVKIFDTLCQVQPRKRAKRVSDANSAEPGQAMLRRENSTSEIEEKMTLMNATGSIKDFVDPNGNVVKKPKRQYTKRVKLSPDIPPSMQYQYGRKSTSLSLEEKVAGNTLTMFQTMFSRQSSTASSSGKSDTNGDNTLSTASIPYELSVLLAAVETQIKEEDVDVDEAPSSEGLPSPSKPSPSYRLTLPSRVSSSSSLLSHASSIEHQ